MSHRGCDCSHWNGLLQVGKIMDPGGCDFLALKACQGLTEVDPDFGENRNRAAIAGMPVVLLYHFLDASDGAAQAKHFRSVVGELASGEYIALDVEQAGDNAGIAAAFVARVKADYGLKDADLFFYGSMGWLRENLGLGLKQFAGLRLWAARYNAPTVGDVSPWKQATIWQYSERGTVPGAGAPGTIDTDVWLGEWPG